MDLIDHVATEFQAAELVLIAEHVGLGPTSRWTNRRLAETIMTKIDKDGIPEPPPTDNLNELQRGEILLEDFLYVAGYVDDKGNTLQRKKTKLPLDEFMTLHNIIKKPDCFTWADDRDPACQRCMLYIYCAEQRLANLPPCFAILWDGTDANCNVCMDAPFCKDATLERIKSARKEGV